MTAQSTVPERVSAVPLRTLCAEVLEGADAGTSCVARAETLTIGTAADNDLVLTDATVSRYHVELQRAPRGVLVVDHGSTNGTSIGAVQIERATVPAGTVVLVGRTSLRVGEGESVAVEMHEGPSLGGLVGNTLVMRRLMARLGRAAASDMSVLVVGESGTGKELVARALHELGPRARGPFVTVDCGALLPTLVASELFGHERGAFTGADRQHVGAFERADHGTVFLDEIGELPAALQATLLGVLERGKLRRLGGRSDTAIDVRVVCATNRDLRAEVNAGTFRLDLYYRIAGVVLGAPPLRERLDDIPHLVEHFLRERGHTGPIESLVSPAMMKTLRAHRWPGNVRELRNMVEAALAMGEPPIPEEGVEPLGVAVTGADPFTPLLGLRYKEAREGLLRQFEARYLSHLLERTRGNVSRAAREADVDRSYLVDLLRRHGLR